MQEVETATTADPPRDPARWWGMGEVVYLAIPTVLNTVSYTLMQFVDGWMIAFLGKEALSAQFMGGITSFTPLCFFMGVLSCVSTFASQNLGAGRKERSAVYGWQGLWVAWAAAAALAMLIPVAPWLLGLFGHEPAVAHLETRYFQVLIAGAGFALSASALGAFFLGIHRPMVTLAAGVTGNVVNLATAYVLIFGHAGFPKLGLTGAAIGSIAGAAVQMLVMLIPFLAGRIARDYAVRRQSRASWRAIKELLRIGAPAGGMFLADVLMWALFMGAVVGSFGTAHLAAAAILNRYWHLCFMPAIGVSAAVTAVVGRYCGARRPHLAWRRAHAGLVLVEAYMVTCGAAIWWGRDFLVRLFNMTAWEASAGDPLAFLAVLFGGSRRELPAEDPAVQAIATSAVIFILVCQAFDALNVIFIGALRGAGDTLWPGIVQTVLAYGLGLGGSVLVAHLKPEWGSLGPWGAASGYIMLLGLVMWGRFLRGKWRTMTVVEAPVPQVEEPAVLPPV